MASRSRKKTPFNKMQFVRENKHLSATEILAKAKEQGREISQKYIYNALWIAKGGKLGTAEKASQRPNGTPRGAEGTFAAQFRSAVLELGATRAETLFADTVAEVRRLIAGTP